MAPMRRKSHGSIRSPHVKRDSQSQVIIEGWLYKLEGAALKQFKQRWCVLADFCLFFYKGPSEEKTTSSILLPSYKISPCTSEDKVSRKFSFKAEHQNMKTYYFAAEDSESMKKWMNAMSLASIMQNFVRSEKYDATFNSASNDDEDSGFTSYRSRRYTSQKLNSTYDSNFAQAAEPLKQRSNSYGDRMGEVYLGSGDKYPNDKYHKNAPCQNVPRRQPLYANAPPKPRRLTQSDSYGLYAKDCYDPEIAAIEASQFYVKPVGKMYTEHQKMMAYHQAEQYFPGSDPVIMGSEPVIMGGGMQYVDSYPSDNVNVGEVPDLYRNQPPRPRSADFLEREVECVAVPDVALYPERRQPQRPKSSLEYYDRYIDSEDGNFDYYREAVRLQADNLYANKNLRKQRQSPRPQAYDQRVNAHYMGNNNNNSCYMANEQISPCYGSTIKDQTNDRYDDCANVSMSLSQNDHLTSGYGKQTNNRYEDCTNVSMSSSQNDHLTSGYGKQTNNRFEDCTNVSMSSSQNDHLTSGYGKQTNNRYEDCTNVSMSSSQNDHLTSGYAKQTNNRYEDYTNVSMSSSQNDHLSSGYGKPQKAKEESMQRLLEWKQRMLQSPLTKRNHLQSNSSDNSSPMTSPYKSDQQQKVFRELQAHDTRFHSNPSRSNDYIARSHSASPQRHTDTRRRNESSGSQRPCKVKSPVPSFSNIDNPNFSPAPKFSNIEHPKFSPKMPEPGLDTSVDIPVENLYKEKVMYCVDSENNEILFSYDDTSPTSGAPKSLQTCHYPPQMHSFTTMPNVSNIGSDNPVYSKYEEKGSIEQIQREERHSLPRSSQALRGASSVTQRQRHTTYSSDDEASIVSDNRYHINKIKSSDITRSLSSEIHIGEPNHLKKLVQQSEGLMCKGKRLSVSAGDLLGKTHEELVLLLIQLRRNQAKILKAKDKLEQQMKALKELNQLNTGKHASYQSKKDLLRQIQLLETQHEVTQPLVTLVDNMIKLGSLYGSSNHRSFSLPVLDTSQEDFSLPSKAVQSPEHFGESSILTQLLADESSFQKRISEIYSLDKGLRHETNSITSLHQDKEMLEYTLSGMCNKILDHQDRPSELQKLKKQQKMIEKELVRVKRLLSTSAKKIEDAASKNDQMEKDILYLRQILKEALKTGSTETKTSQHNRADIEAELSRVQNVLDELANHRHEINNTVLKLKGEAPPTICKEAEYRASPSGASDDKETTHLKKVKKGVEVRASPTGVAGSAPLPVRKKQHSMYLETDLDTLVTRDLAMVHEKELDDIPVYVNAEEINNPTEEIYENLNTFDSCNIPYSQSDGFDPCSMQDINEADERMKRFYGILPKEKPSEIKTVRIVKRQSERRNRERDKKRVTYDDQSSVWVVEEPDLSSDDLLEIDEGIQKGAPMVATRPSSIHLLTGSLNRQSNSQSAHERLFGNAATKTEKSISTGSQSRAYSTKRTKRRHYTVSGYQYVLDPQFAHYFKDRPRSRDDVDMERCLRTANTPDIVRSTIKKNDVFDDRIIERELMLPQKIEIPERYVEIEPEQLSAKERLQRSIKAENICKMLSETTTSYEDVVEERSKSPEALHKKLSEEKRKRAHLLNLNRAIAREVVEKSKAVAANVCSADNQT